MNKPNIKIIQYMHGTHEYFPWSERINRRYCERHGYDYVVRHDKPRMDRHVCWQKIPVILDELCDCDYLLFVDADAVFYSHELTVENELIPELRDKLILMAADCGNEAVRWNPMLPNTGVMLIKNQERVREFFTDWNNVPEIDEEARWKWPPTQRGLWRHILPKFKEDLRTVLDYYIVQGQWGQFIRHFCRRSEKYRIGAMQSIYERLSAPNHEDSTTIKPAIKVVQCHCGDDNLAYQINRKINEAYCQRHGYEYVPKTSPPRDDRSPHWATIPAIREELYNCDFLLYLDAGAFFYSHELKIETELVPHLNDKQIMMGADYVCEEIRHQPDEPNSDVILIRNSEKSAEILQVWDEASERAEREYLRFNVHHEQDACTCLQAIWQEYPEDVRLLKNYYLMNGCYGMFVRNLTVMNDEDRFNFQKEFLENRKETIQV